jgi:hypothetical protein
MRGVGRTLEERLRIEAEQTLSMFMRRDSHTIGAAAFKAGNPSLNGLTTASEAQRGVHVAVASGARGVLVTPRRGLYGDAM